MTLNNPNEIPEIKDFKVLTLLRMAKQARADGYEMTARLYEQAAARRLTELAFREEQEEAGEEEYPVKRYRIVSVDKTTGVVEIEEEANKDGSE